MSAREDLARQIVARHVPMRDVEDCEGFDPDACWKCRDDWPCDDYKAASSLLADAQDDSEPAHRCCTCFTHGDMACCKEGHYVQDDSPTAYSNYGPDWAAKRDAQDDTPGQVDRKPTWRVDHEAGMAYLTFRRADRVHSTREVADLVMVDYDAHGRAVGVEFPWAAQDDSETRMAALPDLQGAKAGAWAECVAHFRSISSERRQSGHLWSEFVRYAEEQNPYRVGAVPPPAPEEQR